ncbi:beta-N-acetylhexosaminidase [Solimonas aquatica]|uniref:Beta-hexosaminidase n=1 Tax=Solimonas aquatica TaxID=489703 RepID=A0A1H9HDG3_9GAMM|nr:beta-N-acetylhexosaminidase [Solimonas aquatica]SEQ60334.1 beta-N-acetylhexosaminidase [Solimonas aquatica]
MSSTNKSSQTRLLGPLMVDVAGLELTAEDRELLCHPLVGGLILFTRNYRDPEQLKALCAEILALPRPSRLLLAVDHEGGRVQRFRVGFTRIPAMRSLGQLYAEDFKRALGEARQHGATIGQELSAYGIDLCFAPVLDIDHGVSSVIGDRAFADSAETIIQLARAFRAGLNSAGLCATGKHFPGHGAVVADSHLELPIDRRKEEEIRGRDLQPFRVLINDGIESLMMAHVRYTTVDQEPASLSRRWIQDILRKELDFAGAIFCDDLSMGGAAVVGSMEERARRALEVGNDMLPVCNDRAAVTALIDALHDVKPDRAASARLKKLYGRHVENAA